MYKYPFYRAGLRMLLVSCFLFSAVSAQVPEAYNIVWDSQSRNSGESMPCGGGDVGLNVWVENDDLYFYMARSGTFDENNGFPKLGRIKIELSPSPFGAGASFRQELKLQEGFVEISAEKQEHTAQIKLWVDVFNPMIRVEVESNRPVSATAFYESWRYEDRELNGRAKFGTSYKWADDTVIARSDNVQFHDEGVLFYHRNTGTTVFDKTVLSQGLAPVKDELWDPLKGLTFGGIMRGTDMAPAGVTTGSYAGIPYKAWKLQSRSASRSHRISAFLHTQQCDSPEAWTAGLLEAELEAEAAGAGAFKKTLAWWNDFWERSFIFVNPGKAEPDSEVWQSSRNYQLFRYMLGCNAYGRYPTKFNGGLFTYDPVFVDEKSTYSPDYRNWGGGTFTAQNQRLVYWPMLKSGDTEMMRPQFDFYRRALGNAELRTRHYWGHGGASFTEQIDNFGLPNYAEYGLDRPENFDPGVMYNAWLEYQWDSALEFCLMILEAERFTGQDISAYLPLIESCLRFFDEHYQYLADRRSAKTLDGNGDLILFPGSAAETYKMAYNPTPTIAGLQTVLEGLLELPAGYRSPAADSSLKAMLDRIPPIPFREMRGHKTIAPAESWARIQNVEIPQLYPVFPYGIYGIGRPGLEVARNTWRYDSTAIKHRNHISWHQDNIFCARLGLTREAALITVKKLRDSPRRFPAFWGPGHDWVPDHNWGGSGMIGLQEMLMQTPGDKIILFPAWPESWDVHFRLHAPGNTVVEGVFKDGRLESLDVQPASRKKDVINWRLQDEAPL